MLINSAYGFVAFSDRFAAATPAPFYPVPTVTPTCTGIAQQAKQSKQSKQPVDNPLMQHARYRAASQLSPHGEVEQQHTADKNAERDECIFCGGGADSESSTERHGRFYRAVEQQPREELLREYQADTDGEQPHGKSAGGSVGDAGDGYVLPRFHGGSFLDSDESGCLCMMISRRRSRPQSVLRSAGLLIYTFFAIFHRRENAYCIAFRRDAAKSAASALDIAESAISPVFLPRLYHIVTNYSLQ